MEQPILSIITINYNNKEGLERTFKSAFEQNCKNFEYVVIDGGSNDGSKSLIETNTSSINHWVSEADAGIYNAMNKGIKASKGNFVMFLNSGDELQDNDVIEKLLLQIDPQSEILYSDLNVINKDGVSYIKAYPLKLTFEYFVVDSLSHPGCIIKKELFQKFGFYNERLKITSDWEWFIVNICKNNIKTKHTNIITSKFYLDGISSNMENQVLINKEKEIVFNNHFPYFLNLIEKIILSDKPNNSLIIRTLNYVRHKKWRN